MSKKKWIIYGVTGFVGLGVLASGAAATASSMDLQTTDGTVIPGGAITDRGGVLGGNTVHLRQSDSSVTVISAPSATTVASVATVVPSAISVGSVASASSSPVTHHAPAAPAPAPQASAPSPASAPSAVSVASAASD